MITVYRNNVHNLSIFCLALRFNIAAFCIFLRSKTYAKVWAESVIRIPDTLLVSIGNLQYQASFKLL